MTVRKRLPAPGKQNAGGRKGKSGPPGNLHHCKRPWEVFWRRRALRPADRWLVPLLETYAAGLINDKGGPAGIANGEARAVEIAQTARAAVMLILAQGVQQGFVRTVDGTWDLAPGAKELARFLTVELNALKALNLGERRAKDLTLTLEDIQRRYECPSGDGTGGHAPR